MNVGRVTRPVTDSIVVRVAPSGPANWAATTGPAGPRDNAVARSAGSGATLTRVGAASGVAMAGYTFSAEVAPGGRGTRAPPCGVAIVLEVLGLPSLVLRWVEQVIEPVVLMRIFSSRHGWPRHQILSTSRETIEHSDSQVYQ